MAGGEGRAVGGKHDDAHRAVVRDRGERVAERLEQRLGQTIARLRPVQRQNGDAALVLAQENE